MNIMQDSNLQNIPFLFVFKKADDDNIIKLQERLITELSDNSNFNFLYLNFEIGIEEIYYGLEWLSDNMKPI
jgi:hypothetical protein